MARHQPVGDTRCRRDDGGQSVSGDRIGREGDAGAHRVNHRLNQDRDSLAVLVLCGLSNPRDGIHERVGFDVEDRLINGRPKTVLPHLR